MTLPKVLQSILLYDVTRQKPLVIQIKNSISVTVMPGLKSELYGSQKTVVQKRGSRYDRLTSSHLVNLGEIQITKSGRDVLNYMFRM